MPIHTYTNWNVRPTDNEEQIEPFRKYFFICEGANTETFYFRKLIDLRKTLNIHPLIDIRLMEKTEEHSNLSYPKQLLEFAETLKDDETLAFDKKHDKMIVIFDADMVFRENLIDTLSIFIIPEYRHLTSDVLYFTTITFSELTPFVIVRTFNTTE